MIEPLPWDTKTFGYRVGRAQYSASPGPDETSRLKEEGLRGGFRLLYCTWPGDGVASVEEFSYISVLCNFELPMKKSSGTGMLSNSIALCRKASHGLFQLAFASGWRSRFRLDPQFRNGEFETLYRLWLEKGLQTAEGGGCFVAGNPEQPKGFLTLEPVKEIMTLRIGLMAVASRVRRQGVARDLIGFAKQEGVQKGFSKMEVQTQRDNFPAVALYSSLGFSLTRLHTVAHLWLSP